MVSDANGTNQVGIDPANSWTVTRRYLDPYGNTLKPSTGSPGVLPGTRSFLNKPLNPTTALVDMGARQYDALTGQFLSVDPIVEGTSAQQAQGYTYANNNPVTFADPSGLLFGSIVKAVSSAAKSVAKTVSSAVSSTYRAVKSVATSVMQPVVDLVQSAARAYSSGVQAAYRGTTSSVSNSWNSVRSGATQVVAQAKTLVKKVDVVGSALKKVAVESYNFAIGDMIRACSGGLSLSCGAELAMMTPWGKFAKAGKLAFKVAGKADDAIGATRSMAAKGADDRVELFRHASPDELADLKATGTFNLGPNSTGKYFADNPKDAAKWGAWLNGGEGGVVSTTVPRSFAKQMNRWEKLDGIGPARFASPEQVDRLNDVMSGVRFH